MTSAAYWLPLVFLALMGVAMLAYVLLDGFDLGVGILLARADDAQKDVMIASIGPFWDANETWLVLGVGILLVAFPLAHGVILAAIAEDRVRGRRRTCGRRIGGTRLDVSRLTHAQSIPCRANW